MKFDLLLTERYPPEPAASLPGLPLVYEQRQRARFKARMETGAQVSILLDRAVLLREGDLLGDLAGPRLRVLAMPEPVSVAVAADPLLLARAAYHLGNRHVAVELLADELRYQPDHVLDQMLVNLGLAVTTRRLPFNPESGAYAAVWHAHAGGQVHTHAHDDPHAHE